MRQTPPSSTRWAEKGVLPFGPWSVPAIVAPEPAWTLRFEIVWSVEDASSGIVETATSNSACAWLAW